MPTTGSCSSSNEHVGCSPCRSISGWLQDDRTDGASLRPSSLTVVVMATPAQADTPLLSSKVDRIILQYWEAHSALPTSEWCSQPLSRPYENRRTASTYTPTASNAINVARKKWAAKDNMAVATDQNGRRRSALYVGPSPQRR